MCDGVSVELLHDVKNYLNITWSDEATDEKIRGLIVSGQAYLDWKGGAALDYETPGMPRTLLMEWVRYARDSATDVFETNFQALLLTMQHERMMADAVESTDTPEDG